jgi:hypothetical protein
VRTGKAYLGYRPSRKSIKRMVENVHALTARSGNWQETTQLVKKLNRSLRGWANYFEVGDGADLGGQGNGPVWGRDTLYNTRPI